MTAGERGGKDGAAAQGLAITETRRLVFARETLLDAILYGERAAAGWLSRAAVHGIAMRSGGDGVTVVVTAERDGRRDLVEVEFGPAQIAAAMIRYCRELRIPLPRSAQKVLELQGDGICLTFTVRLSTAPLHSRL